MGVNVNVAFREGWEGSGSGGVSFGTVARSARSAAMASSVSGAEARVRQGDTLLRPCTGCGGAALDMVARSARSEATVSFNVDIKIRLLFEGWNIQCVWAGETERNPSRR